MSLVLALGAAVAYGLSDFVGGVSGKRASVWAVALVAQLAGTVVLLLALPWSGGTPTGADLAWGSLAGVGSGVGTSFLYRGLAGGRMGVVAPVSGVGAALVPVLTGLALGERPGPLAALGMVLALPGIWLVAREPARAGEPTGGDGGFTDGLLAGAGFGFLFVALSRIGEDAGLLPLACNQAVGAVVVIVVAALLRASWLPREGPAAWGAISGVLGALATLGFVAATHGGYLSVAAVMTSLYPAFTVLLAATVLRERIHGMQAAGLLLSGAAVVLVALG